jgi:hypothetical protein
MIEIPEGWQLVPKTPTPGMERKAGEYRPKNRSAWTYEGAYRAMPKAVPAHREGRGVIEDDWPPTDMQIPETKEVIEV